MTLLRSLRKRKVTLAIFVTIFFLFFYYMFNHFPEEDHNVKDRSLPGHDRKVYNIANLISVVILDFEHFDNAVVKTVDGLQDILGLVPIFVVSKNLPYPPIKLDPKGSAQIVTLDGDLRRNYSVGCASHLIKTDFVLFLPDGSHIDSVQQIKSFISFLKSKPDTKAVAIQQTNEVLLCSDFDIDIKRWTIGFERNLSKSLSNCPHVKGTHGLLMRTSTLQSVSVPFARPFPFTFFVQAKLSGWKIRIMKSGRIGVLSKLYIDPHSKWKRKTSEADWLKEFYSSFGIKQEISSTGLSRYFGCTKHTSRCFGTVVHDMPEYLYQGRWTPPCCLQALRETAEHVFSVLGKCGARYWLEGGTLLGAARLGDIIPWDYDVDIGIYKDDLMKCFPLKHLIENEEPYVDDLEFVWEKASEGEFFRVQFSETNHLHVDIYPFYSKNGEMTKITWFATHRQDVAFPEHFLTPLTQIQFAGVVASAPNNITKFLEYKFGVGVIDNPRYPNLQKPV